MFLQFCAMPVHIVYICIDALPGLKSEICLSEGFFEACDLGSEIFYELLSWPSFGLFWKNDKNDKMSKSGFRPCAARVSEQIRNFLSFVFAVIFLLQQIVRDIKLVSFCLSEGFFEARDLGSEIFCVLLSWSSFGLFWKKWQKRQNVQKWVPPLCRKGFRENKKIFVICLCGC